MLSNKPHHRHTGKVRQPTQSRPASTFSFDLYALTYISEHELRNIPLLNFGVKGAVSLTSPRLPAFI